jgi:carbonic anhydrase/acetyltransferase-like protein (isoleucine patch superfamily)
MGKLDQQLNRFLRKKPSLGKKVYIATGAVVLGDVTLGDYSSVWYNAVLRGDLNRIVVGHHTNIQDNAVLHLADEFPCRLGNYVTVGHSAVVHACTVGNEVLVGMAAVILDGAVVGDQSIVGAGALVTQGTRIPAGSLVLGAPAKVVRRLTRKERAGLKSWALKYVGNAAYCLRHHINVSGSLPA